MPAVRLDQRRVDALVGRKKTYEIRDRALKGFGVRVRPSGAKCYFVHSQHYGARIWRIVADAGALGVNEARDRARALLAAIRLGDSATQPTLPDTPFETVADETFRRYGRRWKPGTLRINAHYLKTNILPWFRSRPIAKINAGEVRRWFASLHRTPVTANRALAVLSVIMRQAEVYGYRPEDSNPCRGIRPNRRQPCERFLSPAEYRRLGAALARHESRWPFHVAIIRLLLLTGCRRSEVRTLQWSSYREDRIFLPDSKTGPRTVWLSSAAREILDRLPRTSQWAFPSPRTGTCLCSAAMDDAWCAVRTEAHLADVRLHDLRHSYASTALVQGETVLTIGRLLGHTKPATTLKYMHVSDAGIREAVEIVGAALEV